MKTNLINSKFAKVLLLSCLFLLYSELSFAQYTLQGVIFDLNKASTPLLTCAKAPPAAFALCRTADNFLNRADIAIDQILREKTIRGCVDGSLVNLERQAKRLRDLDTQLENRSGMRRTYENTLVNVRSWMNTRKCTAPQSPFRITGVVHAAQVTAGAGGQSLAVHWQGNPKFPVRMNFYNVGACPTCYTCASPSTTFTYSANPFIFKGALFCGQVSQPGSYYFNYAVQLVDATGNKTQQESASFHCINR